MGRTPSSATRDRGEQPTVDTAGAQTSPQRQSLRQRILSNALVISIAPALLIGAIALGSLIGLSRSSGRSLDANRDELAREVVARAVRGDAEALVREIDRVIGERVSDVVDLAASPSVRSAARDAVATGDSLAISPTSELEERFSDTRRLSAGSRSDRYLRSITRRESLFSELFFTERNGLTVAASAKTSDLVQSDEAWWNAAWDDGLFLGDVELDESSDAVGLTIAARIDAGGAPRGVVKGVVRLDELQRIADRVADRTGSEVSLLTADGQLLAETRSDHDASRIMTGSASFDGARTDVVAQALGSDGAGSELVEDTVVGYAPLRAVDGQLRDALGSFDGVDAGPVAWTAVVEQPDDVAFAPLAGLTDVQRSLDQTARTFGVVMLVALVLALLAALIVSRRLAQRIVGPVRSLGAIARTIADERLPELVQRAHASDTDEDPTLPAVELGTNDEIEEVADAFNVVSRTAAGLAAEQARSRRDVARMFTSLGRRNQNLLTRQLEFIDRLERDTSDADLLDDLFRLDHLATRMRRNAESLLVLAGEQPARRWSDPVAIADVVRGAMAEVEDYRRVDVDSVDEAELAGSAVGDVTHLLAELIENAAQFSPPDTPIVIVGRRVVDGYALAVVDDGMGMSGEQLEAANRRIEDSPTVDRVPSTFLGLFVVGRLAARHGIRVRLVESTTEGVTAKVLIPTVLIDRQGTAASAPPGASEAAGNVSRRASSPADDLAGTRSGADGAPVVIDVTDDADDADDDRVGPEREPAMADAVAAPARAGGHSATPRDDGSGVGGAGVRDRGDDEAGASADVAASAGTTAFPRVDWSRTDGPDPWGPLEDLQPGPVGGVAGGERIGHDDVDAQPDADGRAERNGHADVDDRAWADTGDRSADVADRPTEVVDRSNDTADRPHDTADPSIGTADRSVDANVAEANERATSDDDRGSRADDARSPDAAARGSGDAEADGRGSADGRIDGTPDHATGDTDTDTTVERLDDTDPALGRRTAINGVRARADGRPGRRDDGGPLEVRRRTSTRGGADGAPPNGRPPADRAVLRTERPPASSAAEDRDDRQTGDGTDTDAEDRVAASSVSPDRAGRTPRPSAPPKATATHEDGIALTSAEREARAARERLARFQRAVQHGRAQTRSRPDGGGR